MSRLLAITFGCFSLSALSVSGRVLSDGMVNFENGNWPSAIDADFDSEFSRRRIARQNNNRRPAINARLQRPSTNGEDVFGGLDPNPGGFNNQQFGQNQGQWFNNNNNGNQRPNQQQGFRPPNQNGQWSAGNNGGNQGQVSNQNQGQSSNNGGVSENERNACNSRCKERVTNEYNPVCGSDSVTYQNRRFLECAADCGITTELSYTGTCVPTTERTSARAA